jgi:hypothetical protein
MVAPFPSATFGKPAGSGAYQIIQQHPAFESAEPAAAFRRLCSSFEWKPTNTGLQHRPCLAMLAVGDSLLVARFSDTGRDAAGRPHTLRIECLLADREQLDVAWKSLAPGDHPPKLPPGDDLLIIGNPDSYWSATKP